MKWRKKYLYTFLSLFISIWGYPYQIVSWTNSPFSEINLNAGTYSLNSIAGENQGNLVALSISSFTVFSGYLSQFYPKMLYLSITTYFSTNAVYQEGVLFGVEKNNDIKIQFTNDISTASLESGLYLIQYTKNTGENVNIPVPKKISLQSDIGDSILISPITEWENGGTYALYFSSSVSDINGLKFDSPATYYFTVTFDNNLDNVSFYPNEFENKIIIPQQAITTNFFVVMSTNQNLSDIKTANDKISAIPTIIGPPIASLTFKMYDNAQQPILPTQPYIVSFSYKDNNGDDLVDNTNPPVKISGLRIWKLDKDKKIWIKQSDTNIDRLNKKVSLTVTNPDSQDSYALMGIPDTDVSTTYAYPVPFKPNSGNSARYGNWNDLITFTNLPSYGKIRIYTITGDLVRELAVHPPEMKWDVKNSKGEIVASGIYIWEIVSDKNRKTGKLAIVK